MPSYAACAAYVEGELLATARVVESLPCYREAIEGAHRAGASFDEGAASARNAAGLLTSVGRTEIAALLLLSADAAPGAAAVGPQIARFSGRTFTPCGTRRPGSGPQRSSTGP